MSSGEFYVGYLPEAPPRLGRRMRKVVALLVLATTALGLVLSLAHRRLPAASFEFGETRTLRGTLLERPVPLLELERPGDSRAGATVSRYLLVGPGKLGAGELVRGFHGATVELTGTLVYRDGTTAVELVPDGLRRLDEGTAPEAEEVELGSRTLEGEIVDSKCFLGVMNPGSAKPHRACAARCIAGGIPPLLRARDADGNVLDVLLVGPDGEALNQDVLAFVAEPVRVSGRLVRLGDLHVLRAPASAIERLQR